jgi:hypothetical protein
MHRQRAFELGTISTNPPADSAAVMDFLKKQYASSPNNQFSTADRAALQAFWGLKMEARRTADDGDPRGESSTRRRGMSDILEGRRTILAAMPDTRGYMGPKATGWPRSLPQRDGRRK